jgi:hypothetical protein
MNFGEQLAYWYLRFNGFFPLEDFILHYLPVEEREGREGTADADLLAVRLPHVYEEVGGQQQDWDNWLSNRVGHFQKQVGLIVEVKTSGDVKVDNLNTLSRRHRLKRAVQRLGMVPTDDVDDTVRDLFDQHIFEAENWVIVKLCICPRVNQQVFDDDRWLTRSLEDVEEFIKGRLCLYKCKSTDRMFFRDDLIQFLAWKSGGEENE